MIGIYINQTLGIEQSALLADCIRTKRRVHFIGPGKGKSVLAEALHKAFPDMHITEAGQYGHSCATPKDFNGQLFLFIHSIPETAPAISELPALLKDYFG